MAYAEFTAFLTAIKRTTSRAFGIDDDVRGAVLAPMLEKPPKTVRCTGSNWRSRWRARIEHPLQLALQLPAVTVCIGLPPDALVRRLPAARQVKAEVMKQIAAVDASRIILTLSDEWRVQFSTSACDSPANVSP